jgi:AcrR family transcriptional regulator
MHTFGDKGYAATTVADIVAGTDYSAGAFYHHFSNKAECLWAVIDHRRDIRRSWKDVAAELDPEGATLEQLVVEAFSRLTTTLEGTHAWTMVMVEYFRAHQDDQDARARLAEVYQRWIGELAQFVTLLQAHGHVQPEREPTIVAMQLFAFAEGLATHAQVHDVDAGTTAQAMLDGTVHLLRD